MLTRRRLLMHCAIGAAVLLGVAIVAPLIGGGISVRRALSASPWRPVYPTPDALIFWGTRVPRVLAAILTGAALALAGLAFQCVLRNPLAEPYILGISAGAGMGKALAVLVLGQLLSISAGVGAIVLCFIGALLPMFLLQALALRQRQFSPITLLLAGVMINVVMSAAILLVQAVAAPDAARQIQLWWLGSMDIVGYRNLIIVLPFIMTAGSLLCLRGRIMNVISFGASAAAHVGVEVDKEIRILIWSAALLASASVALAGPIGFVGLIVPHVLRRSLGSDNRLLAPLCAFYGAAFLLVCDLIAWRAPALITGTAGIELPVGVVTALLGGPVFLWLLVRTGKRKQIET